MSKKVLSTAHGNFVSYLRINLLKGKRSEKQFVTISPAKYNLVTKTSCLYLSPSWKFSINNQRN